MQTYTFYEGNFPGDLSHKIIRTMKNNLHLSNASCNWSIPIFECEYPKAAISTSKFMKVWVVWVHPQHSLKEIPDGFVWVCGCCGCVGVCVCACVGVCACACVWIL